MTWQYWWLRGHTEENARYGEVIVASGEKLPAGQLGYAQIGLGVLVILSGGKGRAQVLFEQALALFGRLGAKRGIAIATGYLGHLAALRDDGKASKLLTESLASPQELGDDVSIALMYNFLGQVRLSAGDNDAAAGLFSRGLDAARRVPDRFPLLISLYDLAPSRLASCSPPGSASPRPARRTDRVRLTGTQGAVAARGCLPRPRRPPGAAASYGGPRAVARDWTLARPLTQRLVRTRVYFRCGGPPRERGLSPDGATCRLTSRRAGALPVCPARSYGVNGT